jgi:hypothetical protein
MTLKQRLLHGWLLGASLAWPGTLLAGDKCCGSWLCVDNCATIPPGAQPALPGTYVNRFINTQDTLAETDDFVIYKHMWLKGGKTLGPLGRYQLDQIAKRLPGVPFPVVVATSKNDELDEARREHIIALLAMRGLTDPTRVIVAYPVAEGLYGEEAERIWQSYLRAGLYQSGQYGGAIPGVTGVPGVAPGVPGLFSGTFGGFR